MLNFMVMTQWTRVWLWCLLSPPVSHKHSQLCVIITTSWKHTLWVSFCLIASNNNLTDHTTKLHPCLPVQLWVVPGWLSLPAPGLSGDAPCCPADGPLGRDHSSSLQTLVRFDYCHLKYLLMKNTLLTAFFCLCLIVVCHMVSSWLLVFETACNDWTEIIIEGNRAPPFLSYWNRK